MIHTIVPICSNTFREAVRDRVFYSILAFAMAMVLFSVLLGKLSLGESYKIIQDFSLAATSLFGALVTVFVGIGLVYKEIEKKTIYNILSKPVARWQFIVGKFLGLSLVIGVLVLAMTVILFIVCYFIKGSIPWVDLYALVAIFFELEITLAFAILFSSFSTPFLSGMFTLSFFIVGHVSHDFYEIYVHASQGAASGLLTWLFYLLPDYSILDYKREVVQLVTIDNGAYALSLGYALLYASILLLLSGLIFEGRDLK